MEVIEDGVLGTRVRRPLDLVRITIALLLCVIVMSFVWFAAKTSADLDEELLTASRRLPDLLVRCMDDERTGDTQVRNVMLAIRVARHSEHGWDNPALPDDIRDVADLLQLGVEPTRRLLQDIDAAA